MMHDKLGIVFISLGLLSVTSAQISQNEACNPAIALQTNFNVDQFVGNWNEIRRSEDGSVCSDWSITRASNNGTDFAFAYQNVVDGVRQNEYIEGTYEVNSARFTLNGYGENGTNADFWVLGTNYQDYAIVYRCENVGTSQRNLYITLLGREKTINPIFQNNMNNILSPLGVNLNDLFLVDQSENACDALPFIPLGEPIIIPGQCDPNISLLSSFNPADFIGTWFEVYSYPSENSLGSCNTAQYSLGDGVVDVVNREVINGTLRTIVGTASVLPDATGMLLVDLEILPGVNANQTLWVVSTDYTSYAISYSCVNVDNSTKQVFSWIVSRTPQLTESARAAVNQVVSQVTDLNFAYYTESDQSAEACFYLPDPSPEKVVEFRGQCDLTIPAVANFDAFAYMGLWHDIEAYPTAFQEGQCNNAFYTLGDGFVDVFNTQVINQTLFDITGVAVPVSTDGSAKLEVTFPVEGTNFNITTNYWVLATDYTSYSLVYTCSYDSQTDTKTIFSWKLSRTKSLSPQANNAMNAVIATVPVLNQQFYLPKDHSAEACFYFPEPAPGVPVRFPGVCDPNITAVPNFQLNSFEGTWYEIETYPKEESGECVQHQYTAAGNSLNLVSNFIQDQFEYSSNSVLTFDSNDGSGKFNTRINVGNNTAVEIPFWILATDYTSYALAYSCMEIPEDRYGARGVYAWKLSRNQQGLSAAANTAINNAMARVDVLEQRYFETVDQTETGCRSLPDIPPGVPVIIDGQCDPNVPVLTNFSAGDYFGTWHLIESYWSEFQFGDCVEATYSPLADGSVEVLNTQVINQTLDTMIGNAVLIPSNDSSAKLSVTFPDAPFPIEYWVIDTDYRSYALVYSCINLQNNRHQVWSWKMSRTRSLSATAVANINAKLNDIFALNNRYYYTIANTDAACFYFPEANGQPVIFRGECDESIQVVSNFQAGDYMGRWYDIESYPQADQFGTCGTANYNLSTVVDVFNTQVFNQTLDTITGTAVLSTTDGTAKLNVTFPIEVAPGQFVDTLSPYWVLATDYRDYALVYSCRNLDNGLRSVSSWKLSRTKTLSPQAQTVINNIVSGIDVLRQDYYRVQGHTDEDCFYFPERNGEPVVFPGQCDNNIQAMPNFNLQSFSGTWREIETYPKEQVGGQCINHEMTASTTSNTTLQLVSNQVFNSTTLVSNDGQLALTSADGSGRFSLTINVGNNSFIIPYWVITTDYISYALVYSCMNRDSETRAVYSWKLSRTDGLSPSANTAINIALSTIDVLDQRYFEPVSQTAEDCFYLPDEINTNDYAVFTGQCDASINAINNFNATGFSGRWFVIESYYDGFTGTCNERTFAQNNNGYAISLTQVANQSLDVTTVQGSLAADNTGKISVVVDGDIWEYLILDTDYENWALIYSCQNLPGNQRRVRAWKMSRDRSLSNAGNTAINGFINTINVLNQQFFIVRDHSATGCFYYPIPDGNPVRFRGRCDQNIQVVTNFDVGAYLGTWYDIESYPEAFQIGTCGTANYSPGETGVDVLNTQVINQQLDIQTGVAVVNSTDGSAKLAVTFDVNGMTFVSPYWVLATDYTSYALVYSCSEIDEEYKQVSTWKLSRTRSLTPFANQIINNIMNNIPILDQRYYRPMGHTEEDCFFYPENNGGPIILDGQCPSQEEVQAVTNFNLNSFSGTWHEVSRFPSELQTGECSSTEFELSTNNNFAITQNIVDNERLVTATGNGLPYAGGVGVINVNLTSEQFGAASFDLYVLDTDYTDFALMYACRNVNTTQKQIYSWKLSRSRSGFSQAANDRINAIVSNNTDLFELYYENTQQNDLACFYYPDFEDGLPAIIELPGPCNDNIRGIPNFDPVAYRGRWFELARYPQWWQFGACDQATYTLNGGVVDVYNTQVVNQTLLIQEGIAEVASTDGSGQLQVTFNVNNNGTINVANYYIMATDYNNFALVYSCRDLPNGNRQVTSWKLSRNRDGFTAAANQTMNQVIANTQGLREDYYMPTSQSDEACFYIPEPNPDTYVLFRGQCGNVSGMANFNMQNYLGVWHEVERYPTGQDDGVCVSAEFSSSGNQFQVVDKNVVNLSANLSTSTVTVTSDGRIRRTSGGNDVDVWVVATDYTNYSLLYSCENYNDEYSRVWSAKHSRTRTLTPAAEAAISEAMANIDVLQEIHYVPVDQSEDTCFYYPEATGAPVVMPGQCDDTIPVQQNFSFEEYSGNWYQIERYPQMWETGNCTGARYTINANGTVDVLNWQVIDGELDAIEGTAVPITDDGSGKVRVYLPSRAPGAQDGDIVTMDLYVLRTDYVSYSLAYSCVNVGPYNRQLGVWKLSRTRNLSTQGNTEINAVLTSRRELDQRYFIEVGQNDECDEPSSGHLVQSSIILLLLCSMLQLFR